MAIAFFDMKAETASMRAEIDAAIARVLDSGVYIGGDEVSAFERELAATVGCAHAVGVSSGTDALHVTASALAIRPGDEIVTTPFTFFATAGAFARLGARIVFADISDATLCLDPRAALSACSDRTRAVVVVNLFGRLATLPPNVPCPIVEDAAQSLGAAPPRGRAAAVSFFPTKNLGALGDAGAILTNDPALADNAALLRSQGARPRYRHLVLGGNFRLDALQAAVLRVKLRRLDDAIAARRRQAARYRELLAGRTPVELPDADPLHVYNQFVIRAPRRDALRDYLAARAIGSEVYYPRPLHLQPCFAALGYREGAFPRAERACAEALALPIYPTIPVDSIEAVADAIVRFYA
jgi:dTDP-4-amino-4,6-dideoxygalactose transaminase